MVRPTYALLGLVWTC